MGRNPSPCIKVEHSCRWSRASCTSYFTPYYSRVPKAIENCGINEGNASPLIYLVFDISDTFNSNFRHPIGTTKNSWLNMHEEQ
ncbi:MAG: hypothetical protein A4E40_00040 [Methanoregulaceae archaeon PtaU1.Bin059]|nr:MAG: hypothetical protein A4E39_00522 [Methanoregulaceae archaeon PtaB.Bin152]OPY43754.1 MAG: hypothetical protein A4E40_00040 [Methanoregulaceae archaeon PtaU1.Bin059]